MAQTTSPTLEQIHALLAAKGYAVSEPGPGLLRIQDVDSGISVQAVLETDILFMSLTCMVVPAAKITPTVMGIMLAASNGISTSHFQISSAANDEIAVTLNTFCKLQDMGPSDEDDILSCVSFLLADVIHARDLIAADLQ